MADFNQNFVTNNVTIESDVVIKFKNPFKNHQQHQIDDFDLFLSVCKKCRCCFSNLINDSDQHTVESWHRQAFLALTEVEMMTPDSENFLCLKCVEILKIFTDLGQTAANLHRKYNDLMHDLASDVKAEREEIDEISSGLQEHNLHSDIVKSDYEIVSDENEQIIQSQQTNSSDTTQNETIHGENIEKEENIQTAEDRARVNKCTVHLTRIDPETVENYEYYSILGSTKEQIIDQISSTSAELKSTSKTDRETNANLKIITEIQNNTKCHICGKTSKSTNGLKTHIRDHHNKPKLSCDLCEKSFLRKQYIRQHIQTYHMSINLSCHLCSAEFESSAKLVDHQKIAHYNKRFKCEDCDAAFGKPCLLSEHIKVMHNGKRWYCHYQDCSSSFPVKLYAILHFQRSHALQDEEMINNYLKTEKNDQSLLKCKICGMIAKSQKSLYAHFKKNHTNTISFSCDLCGKPFSHNQKNDLIDHMYTHHMKKVKFSCNFCPAEFLSNQKLISHEKTAHNKRFKCEKCDASFKEPRLLKEHEKVQHEGKLYNCQVPGCSKSFLLIANGRNHLVKYHSLKGEKYRKYSAKLNPKIESKREVDLKCEICGKIFRKRTTLLSHIGMIHNKNKSCDFCGKTFSVMTYLIDHMQTYHMKVKFKCDLCSSELRSDRKLKLHKKFAHYKNFKCDKCNLVFVVPSLLKEHVKVKHEGKRYHCSDPKCSASFPRKNRASKHLIVEHSLVGVNFNKFHDKLTLQ